MAGGQSLAQGRGEHQASDCVAFGDAPQGVG